MTRNHARVAIVGLGGLFPGAPTPGRLWENVLACADAAREVPPGRWLLPPEKAYDPAGPRPDKVYSLRGCFLDPFAADEAGLDLPPGLLAELDPVYHLALHAGRQAWAGGATAGLDRRRVGVILGSIALPTEKASALARRYLGRTFREKLGAADDPGPAPHPLNRCVTGLPAALLARALGLGGGSYTLDAACASSLYALKLAADELVEGRADAMLAGGVSRPDCLYTQMGFSQLRALSPGGACRPFDARADGLVVGEGAGVFLLKRLDDAERDGDTVHAVLAGAGLSNDVEGGLLAPSSEGQLRAMRAAYAQAGWEPHDVDLIECHATGTPLGDSVEFQSLKTLWEGYTGERRCVLGSVKSTVGHLLTAAGAAAVAKVLAALNAGVLPPTANFESPAPALGMGASPFEVLREPRPWRRRGPDVPRRAAVSAFGFGGVNAHLLLEEWRPAAPPRHAPPLEGERPAVAVVALDAHLGPWDSLGSVRARVLGGEPAEPRRPTRWWGAERSEWFAREGLAATPFAGHYLDEVRVAWERLRIPPRELPEALPQQLVLLQVAARALDAARLDEARLPRTGAFVGLGLDLNTTNFHLRWEVLRDAPAEAQALADAAGPPLTANRVLGALGSIAASRVARAFRLGGPSFTLSSEENSGLRALEAAARALQRGELDAALVGAVDLAGDVRAVLSGHGERPHSPSGTARPFDAGADGVVPGEGAVALVLKRLDDAVRDGDTIHAVIRGVGVSSGGEPAYRQALARAYAEAGVDPVTVGYLEAHGSGRPDEDRREAQALADFFAGIRPALGSVKADVGHAGAAAGLAGLAKAVLCLDQQMLPSVRGLERPLRELSGFLLPRAPQPWLRDRLDGPRRAGVSAVGVDGDCAHVVLEEYAPAASADRPDRRRPLGPAREALFAVQGDDAGALAEGLDRLRDHARAGAGASIEALARSWLGAEGSRGALAVCLVARDADELQRLADAARASLLRDPGQALPAPGLPGPARDRAFYSPAPLGPAGQVAFVFPGSGNDFPGMGRDLAAAWPEALRRQDAESERLLSQYRPHAFWNEPPAPPAVRERIFGQVALGTLLSDLLCRFGVRPAAALGYSLGESSALFALRAWADRDGMLRAMGDSPLFVSDLTGRCDAARSAWDLPPDEPVAWRSGIVERPAAEVRRALAGLDRAYLQIVNTPRECVVGGEPAQVEELARRLGCPLVPVPETTTMHCTVVRPVADAYRELHRLPTAVPPGVRFYSGALGRAYPVDSDSAAEAILAQALDTVDFPAAVEAAYADGARVFVEVGPGASCTRMIAATLGDRPHRARSACPAGGDGVSAFLRLLALLVAERVPVDLAALYPPEPAAAKEGRTVVVPVGGGPFVLPPRMGATGSPPAHGGRAAASGRSTGCQPVLTPQAAGWQPAATARAGKPPVATGAVAEQIARTATAFEAGAQAHAAYLRVADSFGQTFRAQLAFQGALLEAGATSGATSLAPRPDPCNGDIEERENRLTSAGPPRALDRAQCLELAVGRLADVLGPEYAEVDTFPTRVRLPDEPLMLVDRVLAIEGEPRSLTAGRVVTEHDVRPGAWYLDGGRIPPSLAIESGQADLFLAGFLGIDFRTRGLAVYRLLDAAVTFHAGLPKPGDVVRYDIRIDRFFRQDDTYLFRFRFEGTVGGEPLLTMTDGCAGFFTAEALAAGRGLVFTELQRRPRPGARPDDAADLPPIGVESYDGRQLAALRAGDLGGCFGPLFARLPLRDPLRLPGGRMKLVDRVTHLDPDGGRFGVGLIRAEADVQPDDWFLTCHFVDDQVMPGTLMYEGCLHTLRVFLLRLGWVGEGGEVVCEPVPGVTSRLKCRGQVTAATRTLTYEVTVKERGYRPEPYAVVDALMYADGKPIVDITDMSLRLTGLTREGVARLWPGPKMVSVHFSPARVVVGKNELTPFSGARQVLFTREQVLAFATGKPSEAYGERYRPFDDGRFLARLPAPPYSFLDRVTATTAEPWQMKAGGEAQAEYDVPPDAWYFAAEGQPVMPFSVLLEVALQSCGWLAAYMGSALTSPDDLHFRNLGGQAELLRQVTPDAGTLTARVRAARVSRSAGMIIQAYDFEVADAAGPVYRGATTFGFFTRAALAQQVGLRDVRPYEPAPEERAGGRCFPFPAGAPFPGGRLAMIDAVDLLDFNGGPKGLGLVRGTKEVRPDEWFFQAHFYRDPVCPGSLGLESLLQLLKVFAAGRWGLAPPARFDANRGRPHAWLYRGQVVPTNTEVTVQAVVTGVDDGRRELTADGHLLVDGLAIYEMKDFTLALADEG